MWQPESANPRCLHHRGLTPVGKGRQLIQLANIERPRQSGGAVPFVGLSWSCTDPLSNVNSPSPGLDSRQFHTRQVYYVGMQRAQYNGEQHESCLYGVLCLHDAMPRCRLHIRTSRSGRSCGAARARGSSRIGRSCGAARARGSSRTIRSGGSRGPTGVDRTTRTGRGDGIRGRHLDSRLRVSCLD